MAKIMANSSQIREFVLTDKGAWAIEEKSAEARRALETERKKLSLERKRKAGSES